MSLRWAAVFGLSFLVVTAAPARAELVTYQFNGFLNFEWADANWEFEGEFLEGMTQGSPFSMILTWDTNTPVQSRTVPDTTTYFPAYTYLSGIVDGHAFNVTSTGRFGQLTVANGSGSVSDQLSGVIFEDNFAGPTWGDVALTITKWYLFFPSETWSNSEIPIELPSTPSNGGALLFFTDETGRQGKVGVALTSVQQIPEPSAMLMLAVGLFAAARVSRRRAS